MLSPLTTATLLLPLQASPESSRMALLAEDVAKGRAEAVEQFWTELKSEGTPIYEPDGDPRTLVTFLWRGEAGMRNVLLNCDAVTNIADQQLLRLADTDVWYRSYRLPSASQFYYQFSPDDSLVPFEDETDWGARGRNFTADPLNPEGIVIGGTQHFSFAVLPGAPKIAAYEERPGRSPAATTR